MSARAEPGADTGRGALAGVAMMAVGMGVLTVNDAIMKGLVAELPLGQLVSLRGFAGALAGLAMAPLLGGMRALRPVKAGSVAVLSGLLLIGLFLFPLSLRYLPLADAIMLISLSPVLVAIMAPFLLGEHVGWRRWSAVVLGVIGTALVLEPGRTGFQLAFIGPLAVALMIALRDILVRRHIRTESAVAIVFFANLGAGLAGLVTAADWVPMTGNQWGLMTIAAVLLTGAQLLMTISFRHGDAATISCIKYTAIPWAALIGWLAWHEAPSGLDWAGAALITVSGIVITLRSGRR